MVKVQQFNDEILMAFADGELDAPEAAEIARLIAADPALAARVDLFRQTRAALTVPADAGDAPPSPVDAALIARIRAAAVPDARPATGLLARAMPANRNWQPAAIAAALALVLVAAGWLGLSSRAPSGGMDGALVAALDSVPSGESDVGGQFTAIASFVIADGTLCREYETHGTAPRIGFACHGPDGWQDRFSVALSADPAPGYIPASAEIEGLDAFLADAGAGAPLTDAEEQAALAGLR